jgi:hypothetical protein
MLTCVGDARSGGEGPGIRDLEGRHVSMVVVDMEGFGWAARTSADQLLVRDGMYAVLKQAFRAARIPWRQCEKYDRGDGVMILVPAGISKNRLVTSLPEVLQEGLAAHNAKNPPQGRIRLRLALHAGEVHHDENGPTSDSLLFVFRLLDATVAKEELARAGGDLVVIVSEWFFDNVIRHDSGASPGRYRPMRFRTKETAAPAWIYLPGDDSVAVQETTSVNGARRTPADRLADVLLNSNSTRRASLMTFVDALLAIPTVGREASRRMLLEQLRPEIANAVPYSPQSRHHVLGLVTTCMNYQGGLDELLELVRELEGESMPVRQLDETVARLITARPASETGF